jgi:membrane associated rhomboid family serine protease
MLLPVRVETEIEKPALFTYLLIGANIVVFFSIHFLPQALREAAYYDYGFVPEQITAFSIITSAFIHGSWLHIIGNMYYLWLFGRAVEQRVGRPTFMLLYFSSAVAGALIQAALTPAYLGDIPGIGASAAISGVLGAFLILYPWEKIFCLYFSFTMRYATTITLSSIWVLGSWFVFQLIEGLWFSSATAENFVAYWAHAGGFIFGAGAAAVTKYFADLSAMLGRRATTLSLEKCSDMIHEGRVVEAEEKLISALEDQPDDPLILGELARIELAGGDKSAARKLLRRSLKKALKQKNDALAVAAYYGLVAAKERPPDNARRLVIGRRLSRLGKHGHALGVMGKAFGPDSKGSDLEIGGLDKLLYEIAELFAGPLKDIPRATAAFSLLVELFPESSRSLDAKYRLRKLQTFGRA